MKNSQYKWMWLTIIVLAVFNIVPLTILWLNSHNEKFERGGRMRHFMEQELKLTDSQKANFQSERKVYFDQTRNLSDSMRIEKQEINTLLFSAKVDSALIKQHITRIAQLQEKLEWLTYQHFDKLKNLCTPEQNSKFESVLKEMFNHNDHGMGGPMHRGGGEGRKHQEREN